jgi:phage terminase Nu1 subunit (DNA packaging protein)
MPIDHPLHLKNATSATATICKAQPTIGRVNFHLDDGDYLSVSVRRYVLERLAASIQRALEAIPPHAPKRSKASSSASAANK